MATLVSSMGSVRTIGERIMADDVCKADMDLSFTECRRLGADRSVCVSGLSALRHSAWSADSNTSRHAGHINDGANRNRDADVGRRVATPRANVLVLAHVDECRWRGIGEDERGFQGIRSRSAGECIGVVLVVVVALVGIANRARAEAIIAQSSF